MCGLFTRGFVRFVRFYLLWVSGLTCRGSVCSTAHRISGTFQLLPSLLPWSVGPELVRPWSGHASKHFFFFKFPKQIPSCPVFLFCLSLIWIHMLNIEESTRKHICLTLHFLIRTYTYILTLPWMTKKELGLEKKNGIMLKGTWVF